MIDQPSLLDWKPQAYRGEPPHVAHSETSQTAAKSIKPVTGRMHLEIMSALSVSPCGFTDEELQDALGMNANTQRPRRRELQLAGSIKDSAERGKFGQGNRPLFG